MKKKILKIALIIFLQNLNIFSQTPPYYHYTSSDGLASSTVYQIMQSKDGFIWFATSNGISRFDGTNFTTYRTDDGLSSNSIITLAEGKKGEIYLGNYETGIDVLKNGVISSYCNEINGKKFSTSYLLFDPAIKKEQKLYAYTKNGAINSIVENNSGDLNSSVLYFTNPDHPNINKLEILPDGNLVALTNKGLFRFNNDTLTHFKINGLPVSDFYSFTKNTDGSYYLGSRGNIYAIKNNKVEKKYHIDIAGNNDVVAMLNDSNNNLWFSIMNKGFYLIPHGSDKIIDVGIKMDLQNTLVNNFLEDNEGDIWISTFGKGVYYLNNLYLKNYNETDGLNNNIVYSIVKEKSGKLIVGTFNGVFVFDNGKFIYLSSNSINSISEYIYGIKEYKNEFYISATIGESKTINISYKGIKLHLFQHTSFSKTSNGLYLFGTHGSWLSVVKEFNPFSRNYIRYNIFGKSDNLNHIYKIFEDSKRDIWIATTFGICKISNISDKKDTTGWRKSFFPDDPVLSSKIVSIYQDNQNNIWFAGTNGIAKYNLIDNSLVSYKNLLGHDLTLSNDIVSDDQNRIWIANMKGLYIYDGNSIKYLSKQTGLPSNEVLSLYFDEEKKIMYVGTSNGISFLDINLFDSYNPSSPEVKILSIKVGDSVYTNSNNLVFEPNQNNVYIDFKALNFSSPRSVSYKYNLNGVWSETNRDFLDFTSLKKGIYNLQLMAKIQNADWGKPTFLKFRILPAFVETIWFDLIVVSIILILFLIVFRWRLKLNDKKTAEKIELSERINELKHKALSAMMNPHFIFNSLNSVQYLVNCKRNEEANNYIAMMAQLIRKNLDTAGSGFILLSEEINRLKLYLDLEKLRFDEKFSYEFAIDTDVKEDSILIPNMIIQPFVENTLWHGIINSGNHGLITISFLFENIEINSVISRTLIIKICDNGIGINEGKKNKKEDHISKGIQIIEERLRLLSAKMELPKPIMFEDLSNRSNESHGTEVIISLPIPLYKIVSPKEQPASALTD